MPTGELPQRLRALLKSHRHSEVVELVKAQHLVDYEGWVALSAAYLALSTQNDSAEEAANAAEAALRAVGANPARPEAWFNRAVAVEKLGLALTWQPWRDHPKTEADRGWSAEANQRHVPTPADWWPAFQLQVMSNSQPDGATVRSASRMHGDRVRTLVEDQLIPAWASSILQGNASEAALSLERAIGLAEVLQQEAEDPYSTTYVNEIARASSDPGLAAGVLGAALARQALGRGDVARGQHLLAMVEPHVAPYPAAHSLQQLSLGTVAYYRGDYSAAHHILSRLIEQAESQGWASLAGRAAFARAAVSVRSGDGGAADSDYRRAESWLSKAGEMALLASAQAVHARQLHEQGDDAWAWELLRGAFGALPAIDGATERRAIFNAAYRIALDSRLDILAAELLSALEDEARRSSLPALISDAAAQRATLLANAGKPEAARHAVESARAAALMVHDSNVRSALTGLLDRASADVLSVAQPCEAAGAYRTALKSLSTRLAQYEARLYLALGVAEERCGAASASTSYQHGIDALEAALRTQSSESLQISHQDKLWDLYERLALLQVGRHDTDAALLTVLRGRRMAWHQKAPRSTRKVQDRGGLGNRHAQLTFLVTANETFAWYSAGGRTVFSRDSITRSQLEAAVDEWRRVVERGGDEKRVAKQLFDRLLGGIEDVLQTTELLLVQPDGPLYNLSFAALWTGERYLVQHRPVWTVLETDTQAEYRTRADGGVVQALVIGDPAFSPDQYPRLARLPGAAQEARQVAGYYSDPEVRLGVDATAAGVTVGLQTADVVHIAAHAIGNLAVPDQSRIVLASPGGDLSVADVRQLHDIRARVVVLSACKSASGRAVRGRGALSLTQALTEHLVPAAIGMLWDIGDDDSVELASAVHRRLAAGTRVAVALRDAQMDLIQNASPALRLPRVWAAAIGLGAPDVALSSSAPTS